MGDVLERKGYYNQLVESFEGMRETRDTLDRELREALDTRAEIEDGIAELTDELKAHRKRSRASHRLKRRIEKLLDDLEAGGLRAALALQKQRYESIPPEERASQLRQAFLESVVQPEPESPKLASASDSHYKTVTAKDRSFEAPDGVAIAVRTYHDGGDEKRPMPVLLYFHGDAYIMGDLDSHDWVCRSLAALARTTVVAVDYRRAPEARFPTAFDDAYAAACWVASGGLGYAPEQIGVAGDCAGAALAMACCLKARDDSAGPALTVQVLFYPWLDLRPEAPSMQSGKDSEYLADMDWNRSAYAPLEDQADAEDSDVLSTADEDLHPLGPDGRPWFEDYRASPLLAGSVSELPPAFIAYAEDDPLQAEIVQLAVRLRDQCGHGSVHTQVLQAPLGRGFVKLSDNAQALAAISAAAAFASASLHAPTSPARAQSPERQQA